MFFPEILRLDRAYLAAGVEGRSLVSDARLVEKMQLGNAYFSKGLLRQAELAYREVISIAPQIPEAHNNLGTVLKEQGLPTQAQAAFAQALALRPNYASAHSNLLFTLQYLPGQTMSGLKTAHEEWARRHTQSHLKKTQLSSRQKISGRLTVGLVSPDFYAHPVGVFILPWLEHHDRERFKLVAYSDNKGHIDPIARRIEGAVDLWRATRDKSDQELGDLISQDGVDILIDLAGHTAGNRLQLFSSRAARLQVSWLGYSATTGISAMDTILMDEYSAPDGIEKHFTEKIVRLDGLRFCYSPPVYAALPSSTPLLKLGLITYGSFNNLAKVTPEVIETWAKILKATKSSRLVMKWKSLCDPDSRLRIEQAFSAHGINSDRIECRGWSNHAQMLTEYNDIDIALDPFPFSGGLTSCDALYMGVPVLTLPGELPISRQTASFLNALGMTEWITNSTQDYHDKAVEYAKKLEFLQTIRHTLRKTMLQSRLCDGPQYAKSIESALASIAFIKSSTSTS